MYTLQCADEKSAFIMQVKIRLMALAAQLDKVDWDKYNHYRAVVLASIKNPIDTQATLNYLATGFRSEPHALVQRQAELAKSR